MLITVLAENGKVDNRGDLESEFGLSLHVECEHGSILFDTGASGVFADNARALGVDLGAVDWAVLSHHHYDHGGGIEPFLGINSKAKVHWLQTDGSERFARLLRIIKRRIGLDSSLREKYAARICEFRNELKLCEGVYLLANSVDEYPRPKGNKFFFVEKEGTLIPDPFDHELTMVIRESDGIVVFTGCAHRGVLNMVTGASRRFPDARVKAIVGGFHLMGLPPGRYAMSDSRENVKGLARTLEQICDGPIYTGHCTGEKGFDVLKTVLGDRLFPMRTGAIIEL